MTNLKPEDYQAALDKRPSEHKWWYWVAVHEKAIMSALTIAAQPKPNHAGLDAAIKNTGVLGDYVTGYKTDTITLHYNDFLTIFEVARLQLSGQSDEYLGKEAQRCIENNDFLGPEESKELLDELLSAQPPVDAQELDYLYEADGSYNERTVEKILAAKDEKPVKAFHSLEEYRKWQELDDAIAKAEGIKHSYITVLCEAAKAHRQSLDSMELLEALEILVSWHDKTTRKTATDLNPNSMWEKARALIAKYKSQSLGGGLRC